MTTITAPAVLHRQAFTISPTHPAATDLVELHKSVMGCFPTSDNAPTWRADNNILFAANREPRTWRRSRSTRTPAGPATKVLIQSTTKPVDAGHGLTPISSPFTMRHSYIEGDQIDLAVLANPTKAVCVEPGKRGRRVSLTHHHDVRDWVQRQLSPALTIDPDMSIGPATRATSSTNVTIDFRDIICRATVTNPDALEHLIITGIGRARAYGAGLIRTRPAH